MNIFLIRHGEAEPVSRQVSDYDRRLTEDGKIVLQKAVEGWKKLIGQFDFIVSSPLTRAAETAEIIKDSFNFKPDIIFDRTIVNGDPKSIVEIANALKGNNVAFVGHEPSFSHYTAELISGPGAYINFKKGMIVKIGFEGKARIGAGYLEFMIPTRTFK